MPLTPRQVDVVVALDWLLDTVDHRRTGRSIALAVALIRRALAHPNVPVAYLDHIQVVRDMSRERAENICRDYVERLIHVDQRLQGFPWRIREHFFLLDSNSRPVYDWWPDDGALGEGTHPPGAAEPLAKEDAPVERPTAWERLNGDD